MSDDVIKQAAKYLCEEFPGTKPSHAHAAIAHTLGYKSKKALLDDDTLNREDPNLVFSQIDKWDSQMLEDRLASMGDSPIKRTPLEHLEAHIYAALAPTCERCGKKKLSITPIFSADDEPEDWVCEECINTFNSYSTCVVCGPEKLYRSEDINEHGECHDHQGEQFLDPEEEEDLNSFIEYRTNRED